LPTEDNLKTYLESLTALRNELQQIQNLNSTEVVQRINAAISAWAPIRDGIKRVVIRDYAAATQVVIRTQVDRVDQELHAAKQTMPHAATGQNMEVPFRHYFWNSISAAFDALKNSLQQEPHEPAEPAPPPAPDLPPGDPEKAAKALQSSIGDIDNALQKLSSASGWFRFAAVVAVAAAACVPLALSLADHGLQKWPLALAWLARTITVVVLAFVAYEFIRADAEMTKRAAALREKRAALSMLGAMPFVIQSHATAIADIAKTLSEGGKPEPTAQAASIQLDPKLLEVLPTMLKSFLSSKK